MAQNIKHIETESDNLINQSIRNYQINYNVSKKDALNLALQRIASKEAAPVIKQSKSKIRTLYIGVASAAAVLVLFFMSLPQNKMEIVGKSGYSTVMMLPDNSRVVLNDVSKITYKEVFGKRNVNLYGEGYFEVSKGNKFKVKTNEGSVEVLGTRFEIEESINMMNVSCFDGSVKVKTSADEVILEAKDNATIKGSFINKNTVSDLEFPEYAFFRRKFIEEDVDVVIDAIELFFGVNVEINNKKAGKFTGEFITTNFSESMDILCLSMDLTYRKTGSKTFLMIEQ